MSYGKDEKVKNLVHADDRTLQTLAEFFSIHADVMEEDGFNSFAKRSREVAIALRKYVRGRCAYFDKF